MLVDISGHTDIKSVGSGDIGSSILGSLGKPPSDENCLRSIEDKEGSNEWHVANYVPVGIFVLRPVKVRKKFVIDGAELFCDVPIQFDEVLTSFPNCRIFTVDEVGFCEYFREAKVWRQIKYDGIFDPSSNAY